MGGGLSLFPLGPTPCSVDTQCAGQTRGSVVGPVAASLVQGVACMNQDAGPLPVFSFFSCLLGTSVRGALGPLVPL